MRRGEPGRKYFLANPSRKSALIGTIRIQLIDWPIPYQNHVISELHPAVLCSCLQVKWINAQWTGNPLFLQLLLSLSHFFDLAIGIWLHISCKRDRGVICVNHLQKIAQVALEFDARSRSQENAIDRIIQLRSHESAQPICPAGKRSIESMCLSLRQRQFRRASSNE